jgi:hypothetical protein
MVATEWAKVMYLGIARRVWPQEHLTTNLALVVVASFEVDAGGGVPDFAECDALDGARWFCEVNCLLVSLPDRWCADPTLLEATFDCEIRFRACLSDAVPVFESQLVALVNEVATVNKVRARGELQGMPLAIKALEELIHVAICMAKVERLSGAVECREGSSKAREAIATKCR